MVDIKRLGQLAIPMGVVFVVVMMVVPLPTALLDLLIAGNITGGLLILLVTMHVRRPLDFAVFPSLLLIATMFRLALNVSATRLVLLHGYAGKVINTFGHFVVGGSLVVGLVVFLILVVIQFVVITNGAGRVAEVAARFTLDAMPGKQMAIDADLNAGLIGEDEARRRRLEVAAEADFYGAMDGASKFVKGDAIAAVVITLVNLIGGMVVGVAQHGMPIGDAVSTYSLLSIGDGLVSQIPALLISIATGLVVTRATSTGDMASDLLGQFGRQRRAVTLAGAAVIVLALVPGLPKLPFMVAGGTVLFIARRLPAEHATTVEAEPTTVDPPADSPEALATQMQIEPLELELAYDLISLVDVDAGGDLLDRVKALRRKLALELGMVIPPVRTRDNGALPLGCYAIRVNGVEVTRGESRNGCVLVIGEQLGGLPGEDTREPVFGLAAKWVPDALRHQAELTGATVVDRAAVLVTHLAEVVREHAPQLLGREDVKSLVDLVKSSHPTVVEEINSSGLTLGDVQRVLQALLNEHVAIRDLVRILEALSLRARTSTDPEALVEGVRAQLGAAVSAPYVESGQIPVLTLEPMLEQSLLETLRTGEAGSFLAIEAGQAEAIAVECRRIAERAEQLGHNPVLACSPQLRPALRRLVSAAAPNLPVLAYGELGKHARVQTIGVVNLAGAAAA